MSRFELREVMKEAPEGSGKTVKVYRIVASNGLEYDFTSKKVAEGILGAIRRKEAEEDLDLEGVKGDSLGLGPSLSRAPERKKVGFGNPSLLEATKKMFLIMQNKVKNTMLKRLFGKKRLPKLPYGIVMERVSCFMCDSFDVDMHGQNNLARASFFCHGGDFGRKYPCVKILKVIEKGIKDGLFDNEDGQFIKQEDSYLRVPNSYRLECEEYETLVDVWKECFDHDFNFTSD